MTMESRPSGRADSLQMLLLQKTPAERYETTESPEFTFF